MIVQKLQKIQSELKAPKGQYNSFGKYKYRSCEDIMEAVKPLLKKAGCVLTISDTLENIGDRYYVKATATLTDIESEGGEISNTAYAREEETKKGMDSSQITGTASSYARKYALNGLFCIDDTKDADTDEYAKNTSKAQKTQETEKKATEKQIAILKRTIKDIPAMLQYCGVEKIEDMTMIQASQIISKRGGISDGPNKD